MDCLSVLPDEIMLIIFSYLDSMDIINLENLSTNVNVSFDKTLSRKLCFLKEYRFKSHHLTNNVLHPLRAEIVTSLNINCVYWIPREDIKLCLQLPMLECLYAVDTELHINDVLDCSLEYLHTLAILIPDSDFFVPSPVQILKGIKKLCILFNIERRYMVPLGVLVRNCVQLEELWLLDVSHTILLPPSLGRLIYRIPTTVRKFVLYEQPYRYFDFESLGFNCVSFKKMFNPLQLVMEKSDRPVNNIYELNFYKNNVLHGCIKSAQSQSPTGVIDSRVLTYGDRTLDNINYEELNLRHWSTSCYKFKSIVMSILTLPNTQCLHKLSINICLCKHEDSQIDEYVLNSTQNRHNPAPLINPLKSIEGISASKANLQRIVEHSSLIEELEIWECLKKVNLEDLNYIARLRYLKKLTVCGIPNYGNSSFLLEISKNCSNLEFLRISSSQNLSLNDYMCLSLPHLCNLQDLRYQQHYIPLNQVMESFLKLKSSKLRRILFKCGEIDKFTMETCEEFLKNNPQLRFLCLILSKFSEVEIDRISTDLMKIKAAEQIFIVTNDESNIKSFVPYVHKFEMIECKTNISVLDVFNGFA